MGIDIKCCVTIFRLPTLAVLLAVLPSGAVSTGVERIDPATLVHEVFHVGPVRSFAVQQNGELIIEEYRRGMHANRPVNIKSASKSIMSLLVGIAIEQGHLHRVEQNIGEFFPDYFKAHPDPVKQSITLQDLLTMRAGLESTSRGKYGRWVLSDNWVTYVLAQPLVEKPGGEMVYSTGSTHLLSVILARATGMSTREFAEKYLFGPLGIRVGGWDRDPQGNYMGGNNMVLTPSAMLKIGTMVINMGVYRQKQIVPHDWIVESMQIYTRSQFNPYDYGYLWWQLELNGYTVQFAWGNGGQYIMMLPALRAVVVITSFSEIKATNRASRGRLFDFIENRLIRYLEQNV
ncbi:MAG: serine hydrolase [Proteobacteria bacterium]|nr:serine hydrolase [Pseudomonadota bacterium]